MSMVKTASTFLSGILTNTFPTYLLEAPAVRDSGAGGPRKGRARFRTAGSEGKGREGVTG